MWETSQSRSMQKHWDLLKQLPLAFFVGLLLYCDPSLICPSRRMRTQSSSRCTLVHVPCTGFWLLQMWHKAHLHQHRSQGNQFKDRLPMLDPAQKIKFVVVVMDGWDGGDSSKWTKPKRRGQNQYSAHYTRLLRSASDLVQIQAAPVRWLGHYSG